MSEETRDPTVLDPRAGMAASIAEVRRQETLLKTSALQNAILNSANFSSIATDEKGVIQIFNVGAERMLGYTATEMIDKITPADISDPEELIARARALSSEIGIPITPGFEALVFKASRGIEDIYELTYIREDGSRFPAMVSVTALRGYLRLRDRLHPHPSAPAVFISPAGTRLLYCNAHWTFQRLVREAGLKPRSASCRPRIHDLRHSFAVRSLLDAYDAGQDGRARLALLSTYMGHVDPGYTYWYLSAAPELLALAA